MSKNLFEIHADGIDTNLIINKIEVQMKNSKYDTEDLEQIQKLDFQPVSVADNFSFDPALTSSLFEQQVTLPDFKSRKYKYIVGPLRFFATKVYAGISNVFRRNSSNMFQAFINVVHEQIYVRHRLAKLEKRKKTDVLTPNKIWTQDDLPLPSPELKIDHKDLLNLININKNENVLILEDHNSFLLAQIQKKAPASITILSNKEICKTIWKDSPEVKILVSENLLVLNKIDNQSIDKIIIQDLGNCSDSTFLLETIISHKLKKGGKIIMLYQLEQNNFGFTKHNKWSVDLETFTQTMEVNGYKLENSKSAPGLEKDSFISIFQKV